jgi:hypothetical protein
MRWFDPVVLCATLALAVSSFSTEASAFFGARAARACAAAVKQTCGQVQPRAAPLRACFDRNPNQLSRPCGNRLTQVANVAQQCEADVRRLCGGVRRVADVQACMQPRLREVSAGCRRALAGVAVPSRFFR